MKRLYKTMSVLMALLIAVAFVPWSGITVRAEDGYYANYHHFLQPVSVTKPETLSESSVWQRGNPEVIISLDSQMGSLTDTSGDINKGTVLNAGLYTYEPATATGWAEITSVDLASQSVTDPPGGDDIVRVSKAGCNADQIRIVPIRMGTASITLNFTANVTDSGTVHVVYKTVNFVITIKKVIDQVKLQPWFVPENGASSGYQATVSNTGPMIRREGLDNGATNEPSVGTKTLHWSDDDNSNNTIVLAASGDLNHNVTITPKNAGIANIYAVPHVNKSGVTRSEPYAYSAGDNSGTTHVVVAKVKPEDQIIYVTQEADLIVDTDNTYPNTTDTLPTDADYPNTAHSVTHEWSLVNPAASDDTGKTGTYIEMTDDNMNKVRGIKVGKENVKAITPPPSGYYAPDDRDAVNGTGTIYVVQPTFLIPPRVVNKDGDTTRKTHDLPTDEITGNTGNKVKYVPASRPDGAASTLAMPETIPDGLKNIAYSAPASDNATAKGTAGNTKIEGVAVGTTDITANFARETTITGTDTAKALVVRDYVGNNALAAGATAYLGPNNFSGITVSGETYTVKFGPSPSDKVEVLDESTGQIKAKSPTGGEKIEIPVTITRKVTKNGTEYTLTDQNICLVEVKNSPLDITAGFVRYTGRKLNSNNAKDITGSLTYTYKSNGDAVTGDFSALETQLSNAAWSSVNNMSTVSADGKKLTPKPDGDKYEMVGNEKLTTPASSLSHSDYTINSATINVDIYGYEFTGKRSKSYTKQSKKDVDYTISLYNISNPVVPLPSGFKADKDIIDELDRVEILDKNENPLTTEIKLTKANADNSKYNYKKGSVVLTLEDTFLDTLDYGTYRLIGYFNPSTEPGQVDTLNVATLIIEKPVVPGTDISTADVTRVGGVTVLFGTSLAILLWLRKKRRDQVLAEGFNSGSDIDFSDNDGPFYKMALSIDDGSETRDDDTAETGRHNESAESHGRFRKYDPFDPDSRDNSQENAEHRTNEADGGVGRGQVKHLPPRHVALDEDAREFDRRARRYSPDQRERMREEERRRYYERRYDDRGYYRYSERDDRYRDEMNGYYPRRRGYEPPRGNGRRGGRRPY